MLSKLSPVVLFSAGVLLVMALFPLAKPSSFKMDEAVSPLFKTFPNEIGGWSGQDESLEEKVYEILETRNVLSRLYKNAGGESIHLLLVSSQKDRRVAHPPEVCYTASNYEIIDESTYSFEGNGQEIPVKRFAARNEKNPADRQEVIYLYKVGEKLTTNYYAQQLQFAWDRIANKDSKVLLIRLAGSNKEINTPDKHQHKGNAGKEIDSQNTACDLNNGTGAKKGSSDCFKFRLIRLKRPPLS